MRRGATLERNRPVSLFTRRSATPDHVFVRAPWGLKPRATIVSRSSRRGKNIQTTERGCPLPRERRWCFSDDSRIGKSLNNPSLISQSKIPTDRPSQGTVFTYHH